MAYIYIYFINDCWLSTIPVHTRKKHHQSQSWSAKAFNCSSHHPPYVRNRDGFTVSGLYIYIIYYLFGLWWTTYIGKYNQTHSNAQYQIYTQHKYIYIYIYIYICIYIYNIVLIMYMISIYAKYDTWINADVPIYQTCMIRDATPTFFCSLPSHDWAFKQ